MTRTVEVRILFNSEVEWHETFVVVLEEPLGASLGENKSSVVNILDADVAGSLVLPTRPIVSILYSRSFFRDTSDYVVNLHHNSRMFFIHMHIVYFIMVSHTIRARARADCSHRFEYFVIQISTCSGLLNLISVC